MRNLALIPALLAALALVACSGGSADTPASTSTPNLTIAAVSTEKASGPPRDTPTPTPLVAKSDVRLCTASDIATQLNGVGYTGGGALTFIELRNTSRTACQIRNAPDVQFIDAAGAILDVEVSTGSDCASPQDTISSCIFRQPLLLLPSIDFDPIGLRAGQVMLTLDAHSSSESATGTCHTPPPQAKQIKLLLPGSDRVAVDTSYAPCGGVVGYRGYGPGNRK